MLWLLSDPRSLPGKDGQEQGTWVPVMLGCVPSQGPSGDAWCRGRVGTQSKANRAGAPRSQGKSCKAWALGERGFASALPCLLAGCTVSCQDSPCGVGTG